VERRPEHVKDRRQGELQAVRGTSGVGKQIHGEDRGGEVPGAHRDNKPAQLLPSL